MPSQGRLPLVLRPETDEEALQASFRRLPAWLRRRGLEAVMQEPAVRHCLELAARARRRRQDEGENDDGQD